MYPVIALLLLQFSFLFRTSNNCTRNIRMHKQYSCEDRVARMPRCSFSVAFAIASLHLMWISACRVHVTNSDIRRLSSVGIGDEDSRGPIFLRFAALLLLLSAVLVWNIEFALKTDAILNGPSSQLTSHAFHAGYHSEKRKLLMLQVLPDQLTAR
mmetsp:Transcript_57497/g.117683  ORF Transcript_57497/g.117683 Transcript_57497/m.117683 type:complete len:155 (-) Transcript_57497:8-472(-)